LLNSINLELEFRRSNLIDFYANDQLATSVCELKLDVNNILDLRTLGEIEDESTMIFEVISKDPKSIRTKTKERSVNQFTDKVIPMRLFTPEDVIQC